MLARFEEIQLRIGRMKAHYSSERVTSSKDMTMVERSIVNDYFTLDRQQGVSILGHLDKGGTFDSQYWIDIFQGTGRTGGADKSDLMIVGRYQWNVLGEALGLAMSDLARRPRPAAFVAVAASRNTSRYSGFSSDGGIQLPGFEDYGLDDQYEIEQWMLDCKYHHQGFSLQASTMRNMCLIRYPRKNSDARLVSPIWNICQQLVALCPETTGINGPICHR